ncbi:MAG: lipopolysaccharide assembly LapA domain-containing protein [Candidatus Binatia bacterium]
MIKVIKTVFFALLFILGITFSMENTKPLVLHYYFGLETPPIPLFLLVLFAVFLGVLLAGIGFILDERSLKRVLREKEQEIESLEREVKTYQERGRVLADQEKNDETL